MAAVQKLSCSKIDSLLYLVTSTVFRPLYYLGTRPHQILVMYLISDHLYALLVLERETWMCYCESCNPSTLGEKAA